MTIEREPGKQELLSHEELFERMYDKLPRNFSSCGNYFYLHLAITGKMELQPELPFSV